MTHTSQFDSSNHNHSSKKSGADSFFDINRIVQLFLKNWYLFVISFPLCFGVVIIHHRYTIPVYRGSATVLLKNPDEKSLSRSDLTEGFGLAPEISNIENQTFIIKSRKVISKAIDRLDFGISYFVKGRFKDTELYHNSPFYLELDSTHSQLLNTPIYVESIGNNTFRVSCDSEGGTMFNFSSQSQTGGVGAFDFKQIVKENEWVKCEGFSFRIHAKESVKSASGLVHYVYLKSNEQITSEYRGGLDVNPYREGSSILYISNTGTNPSKINAFLDALCEVIVEYNLERKNDMASRSISFIESQLETISDTLDKVQDQLLSYRKENRFMGPSDYSQKLADQYFDSEKELKLLELQKDYYKRLKTKLHAAKDIEDYMLPVLDDENKTYISQLILELIQFQGEMDVLKPSAQQNNYYLKTLQKKIDLSIENISKAINQSVKSIELKQDKINKSNQDVIAAMDQLPELEKSYLKIDRNYRLNDAIYTFMLQKHSETQISKASNVPDSEVIDQASVSGLVSPNKSSNYNKAFMLALLIPIGIVVLKEFLNTKVRGKEDLDHLIPSIPMMGMVMHNKSEESDVIRNHPNSIISESFRAIRTKLRFVSKEQHLQVISLTSTNTGEGKTFCAQNLASVFSISGKKTVILGFDMRKPRLTTLFGLEYQPGLSNYLIGQNSLEEVTYNSGQANLFVIPAGEIPPNPSELIASNRTQELFTSLRENYDIVIVDSPPIGLVADARLLMQHSDCNLYVVRANYTVKDHLVHTINDLLSENVTSMGVILNDVNTNEKGYGYYSAEYYGE